MPEAYTSVSKISAVTHTHKCNGILEHLKLLKLWEISVNIIKWSTYFSLILKVFTGRYLGLPVIEASSGQKGLDMSWHFHSAQASQTLLHSSKIDTG